MYYGNAGFVNQIQSYALGSFVGDPSSFKVIAPILDVGNFPYS